MTKITQAFEPASPMSRYPSYWLPQIVLNIIVLRRFAVADELARTRDALKEALSRR